MKVKYIKDLQFKEKLVDEQFAVKSVRRGKTMDGRDFFDLIITDKSGELAGKIWEDAIVNCDIPEVGEIGQISGTVEEFRDKQQLKITLYKKASEFDYQDFLPSSSQDLNKLWKYLKIKISEINDPDLKTLVNYFFADSEFIKKFKLAPGAEMIHHAYLGGLMEHLTEMLKLSETVLELFPGVNRDLLIAGILFHDLGKTEELHINHTIYRTVQGSLLGHITLGVAMVSDAIKNLKDFPQELGMKIQHLIISHHGRLEFGSPMKPMTVEAVALNYLDELSSKLNVAVKIKKDYADSTADFSEKNFALDTKLFIK